MVHRATFCGAYLIEGKFVELAARFPAKRRGAEEGRRRARSRWAAKADSVGCMDSPVDFLLIVLVCNKAGKLYAKGRERGKTGN